jgi:hypothetical protein
VVTGPGGSSPAIYFKIVQLNPFVIHSSMRIELYHCSTVIEPFLPNTSDAVVRGATPSFGGRHNGAEREDAGQPGFLLTEEVFPLNTSFRPKRHTF